MGVGLTQHFFKCDPYTLFMPRTKMGRDSAVGKATRYGLDGPGIEFRWCRDFRTHPYRHCGTLSHLYNGYRVFLGGKTVGASTIKKSVM
jgi:hypothetical protein